MKIKKMAGLLIVALVICGLGTPLFKAKAYAAGVTIPISFAFDASCNSSVNGNADSYDYYLSGETANLQITNSSPSQTIVVSVDKTNPIAPGATDNVTLTLSGETEVQDIPDGGSCSGTPNLSTLFIAGASGSLSCTISNNQVWNISGGFDYVAVQTDLYRGSTYVQRFSNDRGGPGIGDTDISTQFSAQTTAQTYYLYDGTGSSGPLISQVTCPAKTVASSSKSASSSAGSNTTATPTPTPSPTTKSITPTTNDSSSKKPSPIDRPQPKTSTVKTGLSGYYIGGSVVLVLIIVTSWLLLSGILHLKPDTAATGIRKFISKPKKP